MTSGAAARASATGWSAHPALFRAHEDRVGVGEIPDLARSAPGRARPSWR